MINAWKDCKIGKPSKRRNFYNDDCRPIKDVFYITDIQDSIQILRLKKISPDENYKCRPEKAVPALCLSPTPEHRTGTVKFHFNLDNLLKNKTLYKYNFCENNGTYIFLILVTSKQHDLDEYDHAIPKGPWWQDPETKQHYYNSKKCHIWFMFEGTQKVDKSVELDVDKRNIKGTANSDFITCCISQSIASSSLIKWKSLIKNVPAPIVFAIQEISDWLNSYEMINGTIDYNDNIRENTTATAVIKDFCRLYADKDENGMRGLIASFKDRNSFDEYLAKVISKQFDISDWKALIR